eukprot:s1190_g22.t1
MNFRWIQPHRPGNRDQSPHRHFHDRAARRPSRNWAHPSVKYSRNKNTRSNNTCGKKIKRARHADEGHIPVFGRVRSRLAGRGQTAPSREQLTERQEERRQAAARLDELIRELFRLQEMQKDLNKNDLLEEQELIKLNQKIAMLHYGKGSKDADRDKVEEKYRNHFREHLDAEGRPVNFTKFKDYMEGMLNGIDPDPRAQEMMLEQWIAEAESGRVTEPPWFGHGTLRALRARSRAPTLAQVEQQQVPRHQRHQRLQPGRTGASLARLGVGMGASCSEECEGRERFGRQFGF